MPMPEIVKQNVKNCARCGKNHRGVKFIKFINPGGPYTHWAHCPWTDDPLFIKVPGSQLIMPTPSDYWPNGMRVYGRKGSKIEKVFGVIVGYRSCKLEGCTGLQLCVRWPDGKKTWPCTKGLTKHRYGVQIK